MTEIPEISTVGEADQDRVLLTLTAAFIADPLMRWMLPEPAAYIEGFPRMLRAYAGDAFVQASAHATSDFGGGALWLPPDSAGPDEEAFGQFVEESIREEIREDLFAVLEKMDEYHPHDAPTWYLAAIGVDPTHQRRGIGSAMLQHQLIQCDEAGIQAYLESSNPANMSLYERHGFRTMGRIKVGSSPPVHPMLRPIGG